MSKIFIELRNQALVKKTMQSFVDACRSFGHDVHICAPFSGSTPGSEEFSKCDLAILWNGIHSKYRKYRELIDLWGVKTLFVELGWYPQRQTFQVDPKGFNMEASWANDPLQATGKQRISIPNKEELLVILQLDIDTQIQQHSPYFKDMASFINFLAEVSPRKLRIRKHPRHKPSPAVSSAVQIHKNCFWDDSPNLVEAMSKCKAVATINSSSGVEALIKGYPVLCFGNAIYRHSGAVLCCTNDKKETRKAIANLDRAGIWQQKVNELIERLMDKQWTIPEVPKKLRPLLEEALK